MSVEFSSKYNYIVELIFFTSLFIVLHSYVIYPFTIKGISFFFPRLKKGYFSGKMSLIISAFNESSIIRARVENIAAQSSGFENLEVLIGSDGSSDDTVQILQDLSRKYKWLRVFAYKERRGKASVLNDLVKQSTGEVLIFSDANTIFDSDAIKNLVTNFSDRRIGGICGKLILTDNLYNKSGSADEKKYWQYETLIKKAEGDCGVLVGANGGIYAIRKSLFTQLPERTPITDDLFVSLSILLQDFKFIFNESAYAYEEVAPKLLHEFKRKIRFGATNLETIKQLRGILFNKNLLFTYAIWSHKLFRWFMPIFFIVLFVSNIYLFGLNNIFNLILFVQFLFYILALIGFIFSILKIRLPIISLPFFFVLTNLALFIGFIKFILNKHSSTWQSTPR